MSKAYIEFLKNKVQLTTGGGLKPGLMHPSLFPHQRDCVDWALRRGKALIAAKFGMGKCHGIGTKILMADGTIKNVEDVQVGDQLMGDDSTPRNVLSLARGREQMYRITLKNGDSYTCNESHMLSLKVSNSFSGYRLGDVINVCLRDYLRFSHSKKRNKVKHYKVAVDFPAQNVPMDPYLYGTWLGDGHCGGLTWTINHQDTAIVDRIRGLASNNGLAVREHEARGCTTYHVSMGRCGSKPHINEFYFVKGSAGDDGKRIDSRYLQNTRAIRLQVLAGLVDTDGYLIDKCYEIATKWEGLRDDILFLARSLGFSVCHAPKLVNGVTYYRIWISGNTHLIPCITRKKAEERCQIKNPLVYGFSVEPLGEGDYYGFEIDGNHLYLLGDFTVTHNTRIQVELLRQVQAQTGRKVLVICPLGVRHQFIHEDGPAMDTTFTYIGSDEDGLNASSPFLITNYERVRDGQISEGFLQSEIAGICLDEGAILGNLGTKTQQEFSRILSAIPYRWVATATPAPNDYRQLIYFADFLDAMDAGQSLTRWFGRNPDKAGDLQLLPHMEREFWLWIASWALFVDTPSDLGYSDEGYVMPELEIRFHRIAADHLAAQNLTDQFGQHFLFADTAAGVQQAMKEKRNSLEDRIAKVAEIVHAAPGEHFVIWHDLEDERKAICKAVPAAKAVYGSQETDEAERLVLDFTHGRFPILAAKPQMFGAGANFQKHCHRAIYAGVGFKFRDFIQSLHRLQRYGQMQIVIVDIIHTDAEDHVVDVLMRKWRQHDEMVAKMRTIVKEFGLTNEALSAQMQRTLGVKRQADKGTWFTSINNDCVIETMAMADNSVDEIVTSIPFGNHYEYVASLNDFGHNQADADFWTQMDFLIPELLRVLKPGRMACIHVKDRLLYGHQTAHGMMEVDYFTHDCARAFRKHGFVNYGEIFIPTDVVRENNSTNRLGWSECCKDGSKMGVGLSEKVLLFRKPQTDKTRSYADEPVRKDKKDYSRGRWQIDAHSLWRSNGQGIEDVAHVTPADDPTLLTGMDGSQIYNWYKAWSMDTPYDYHQHVAFNEALGDRLPAKFMLMPPQAPQEYEETVWTDVLFMRTLNMNQARHRVEKHICPLPLDIVERLIVRYSNPGELIFDPFAGLHTVPYMAVKLGRCGLGTELNSLYWENGVKYCQEAEIERATPKLFEEEPIHATV